MAAGWDIEAWALILAVAVLFLWYFWHVITSIVSGGRRIAAIADGAAARQRAELEHEAKYGPRPLWYRAVQKMIIAVLFVSSAWLVWDRLFS